MYLYFSDSPNIYYWECFHLVLFHMVPCDTLQLCAFLNTKKCSYFLPDIIRCSRATLGTITPRTRAYHFSKKSCFLFLEYGIRNQAVDVLGLLECNYSRKVSAFREIKYVYILTNNRDTDIYVYKPAYITHKLNVCVSS